MFFLNAINSDVSGRFFFFCFFFFFQLCMKLLSSPQTHTLGITPKLSLPQSWPPTSCASFWSRIPGCGRPFVRSVEVVFVGMPLPWRRWERRRGPRRCPAGWTGVGSGLAAEKTVGSSTGSWRRFERRCKTLWFLGSFCWLTLAF